MEDLRVVRPDEVKRLMLGVKIAEGPDGITARFLKGIPLEVTVYLLSTVLWCGEYPEQCLASRTVLLSKNSLSNEREISVPSVSPQFW